MKTFVIATHNRHKTREIAKLLRGVPAAFTDLTRFPKVASVCEDGRTLLENAVKKARAYSRRTGLPALADDTGLEVDALSGAPGLRSARYAGPGCAYSDNNRKLLRELGRRGAAGAARGATFRCVVALADPATGRVETCEGALRGKILESSRGRNGFGYDPLFYIPRLKKTLAELSLKEKNRVSHRAKAVLKIKKLLEARCAGS